MGRLRSSRCEPGMLTSGMEPVAVMVAVDIDCQHRESSRDGERQSMY
jgi:hypothetical protein